MRCITHRAALLAVGPRPASATCSVMPPRSSSPRSPAHGGSTAAPSAQRMRLASRTPDSKTVSAPCAQKGARQAVAGRSARSDSARHGGSYVASVIIIQLRSPMAARSR